jgi:hypothetical protein
VRSAGRRSFRASRRRLTRSAVDDGAHPRLLRIRVVVDRGHAADALQPLEQGRRERDQRFLGRTRDDGAGVRTVRNLERALAEHATDVDSPVGIIAVARPGRASGRVSASPRSPVAFRVEDRVTLEAWEARLRAMGLDLHITKAAGACRSIWRTRTETTSNCSCPRVNEAAVALLAKCAAHGSPCWACNRHRKRAAKLAAGRAGKLRTGRDHLAAVHFGGAKVQHAGKWSASDSVEAHLRRLTLWNVKLRPAEIAHDLAVNLLHVVAPQARPVGVGRSLRPISDHSLCRALGGLGKVPWPGQLR